MAGHPNPTGRAYILVGVFPGQPEVVVAEAARFAARFDAELVCAYVDPGRFVVSTEVDGIIASLPIDPDVSEFEGGEFDRDLKRKLENILADAGIPWSTRSLAGEPADALRRLAGMLDAEMIVVGTRRHGRGRGIREFLGGSVAAHLAHRQGAPVVVVPLSPVDSASSLPWE